MSTPAVEPELGLDGHERGNALRVVIADDSVLLREGIARLSRIPASTSSGRRAMGRTCSEGRRTQARCGRGRRAHAADAHRRGIARGPPDPHRASYTAVVVLSQYVDEASALELLSESSESIGYLLKDRIADVASFTDAVRRVAGGGSALDPEVVGLLLGPRRREDPLAVLSPREREVLALMAEGRSNAAMAEAHGVSERAVEKHVTAIFSKLDLPRAGADHRRVLAVLTFLRSD